ncbi:nitrate reductase / nitrite oxidoreductase, beta subunit [Cupriavidus metallidurans]|jgi:nitrate reductase / nitrite oxidoreductase, beta subunit|uniref:nitrate reductase subunit beta n=1 Tax=Cupriavidus TaxID=106589 RepID=UPI0002A2520D|nr:MULTISPECIES: nitrate reductase subunit beta [Cupriavidus]AVA36167.1 nitrate reductase subunit beta [Cupriavidus metallidurans]EKZ99915.1 nitrate reductase A subunit beta [Cupriavidus sp. HMR-1]KWW37754.1 Respiratory nitrate reductase 1 beta chain [Cupriavidus metallidurans]MDE4918447.1 nitrate reductase subunit beta [Cupriavidus metallidurans]UBM09795.1 nitrate reductase subunit beta [Cupriavidus metallidurans]
MKIRAQVAMVLNLDKCIGCHTCSVTCKNVWTSREGVEYAWFNNVETKPGVGFPKEWENQDKWQGGWKRNADGSLTPRQGGKAKILANIFANPNLPQIDDYYEPFTFDYEHLQNAPLMQTPPTARPVSAITGKKMEKIEWGPNWEDDLGGEFDQRSRDKLFEDIQKDMYSTFENTFMMYLPRLCEHCLNPTCVASCPSGSVYKREEDGIVLVDQDKCRGWRMCVSGCPYKKIYFNWQTGKAEKCVFCYPRIEAGQPTVCSETCVGRIRYLGVMLYDADRIEQAASVADERDLYQSQLDVFLDPHDPKIQAEALRQGIPQSWLDAAVKSPVYKMACEWKVAFPLHPEYRTLPMVWYIPPLSPIQSAAESGFMGMNGVIPDVKSLRIPVKYLANLLTAGDVNPVLSALERMLAMRAYKRSESVDGLQDLAVLEQVGLTPAQVEDMYQIMAIANYEDRFVVPSSHKEMAEDSFDEKGSCGFSFGNGCSGGTSDGSLFGTKKPKPEVSYADLPRSRRKAITG